MTKLEQMLDEAYDDLDAVDSMFDWVSQNSRISVDYCLEKRKRVCDRIQALKQEIALDKEYERLERPVTINMAKFFLANAAQIHKIDKILYKKDTAVAKQNSI